MKKFMIMTSGLLIVVLLVMALTLANASNPPTTVTPTAYAAPTPAQVSVPRSEPRPYVATEPAASRTPSPYGTEAAS